jgi:NADH dehydrogenase FAD-containing subunit
MPVVVVVGGGFAGTLIAEALDETADVVLIDARDAFVNVSASLRALTQPAFAPSAFFPYEMLLRRGRFVRDSVVSVDAAGVTLSSGLRVDADYLVLATGSSYPHPAHPRELQASAAEAIEELAAGTEQLAKAESVLIVGAGPVGLELAGEIREVWPDKRITMLARGEELLPGYLPEVRDDLERQLAELKIDLRTSTSLRELPSVAEGRFAPFTVTTDSGDEISADLWFRTFGARVRTGYLADEALVQLTPQGMVPVTEHLTVVGHEHAYAVGDIADLSDPKMATWAQTQAGVVVENIQSQLDGREPTAVYTPTTALRIFLPLGTRAGVGQLPTPTGGVAPAPLEVVIDRKGRDLFTARFAERFHSQ